MKRPLTALCAGLLLGGHCAGVFAQLPDAGADAVVVADGEPAAESEWRYTAALETWVMGAYNQAAFNSLVNPGNMVDNHAGSQLISDTRLNLRMESDNVDMLLYPRLLEQINWTTTGPDGNTSTQRSTAESSQINQAFLRLKGSSTSVVMGRELFTWGPATFRSPSNPVYFDAGRTNPLAATPGIDLVRTTVEWADSDAQKWRMTLAQIFSTNQIMPAVDGDHTSLIKIDHQGSDHLASLIVAGQASAQPFVGGFVQSTVSDALMIYGEFGSQQLHSTLNLVPAPVFYAEQQPGPQSNTLLLGGSYTLESGQALLCEYLYNSSGLSSAGEQAYFAQAGSVSALAASLPAQAYGLLGQNLSATPGLLSRNYLWLNWQSNPQESQVFWRVGWTQNMDDQSGQAQVYYERNFIPKLSGFVSVLANSGGIRQEFGALQGAALILGIKLFVF